MSNSSPSGTADVTPDRYSTHKVLNQAKPATRFNAFSGDAVLRAAIAREAPWAAERCDALGAIAAMKKSRSSRASPTGICPS